MVTIATNIGDDAASAGDGPFDSLLGYHLRRLSVVVMADLTESLAPFALKPTDASILFVIGARAGVTQSDIGRILGIQRANMAPLAAALLKRGLIEREPVDGRSQALVLSATGKAIRDKAWRATTAHELRLFRTMPKTARTRIIMQLRAIWETMEQNGRHDF